MSASPEDYSAENAMRAYAQPEPTLTERIAEALRDRPKPEQFDVHGGKPCPYGFADHSVNWDAYHQALVAWLDSLPARVEAFARAAVIKQAEVCTPREHWPPLITRTVTDASLLAALPALSTPQTEKKR